jgi:diguanylate cyclase (GGDEF)-like protein
MTPLNLDEFPNSPHASELRRGPGRLRFDPSLEAQYVASHLERVRLRVRVWSTSVVLVCLLFAVVDARRSGLWSAISLTHLLLVNPCAAALGWLAWSGRYRCLYLRGASFLLPVVIASIGVFIAIGISRGRGEALAAFTIHLVGVFFFAGLLFRQAALVSAITLAVFAAASLAAGLAAALLFKCMAITLVTCVVCAIVYRDVEISYRRNFLEHALINELATRDGLSGLMNRRAFDEHLSRVWRQGHREQRPIAVLLIDIDEFKQYNDSLGHHAGDRALRGVAKVIERFARRPLDLAARFGGDEFTMILYDLPATHAHIVGERIREAVQNLEIESCEAGGGTARPVTVSVGVGSALPGAGRTPQGTVRLADDALYEAKRAGRNRVIVKGTDAYWLLDTGAFSSTHRAQR